MHLSSKSLLKTSLIVMPAKAGIQSRNARLYLDASLRWHDKMFQTIAILVCLTAGNIQAMSDEERYHQLGRDYVMCTHSWHMHALKKLALTDRALLYEASKPACERWKSQDTTSVLVPRVENIPHSPLLDSWKDHALEQFSKIKELSDKGRENIKALQSNLNYTPIVNPQISSQSVLTPWMPLIVMMTVIGTSRTYHAIKDAFNVDFWPDLNHGIL